MKLALLAIIINLLLILVQGSFINNNEIDTEELPEVKGDKFYYFGYGSNMLTKRIHVQNPTAVKIGPGVLKVINYYNSTFRSHYFYILYLEL